MATLNASALASSIPRVSDLRKGSVCSSSHVLGLPQIRVRDGRVRCSAAEEKAKGIPTIVASSLLVAGSAVMSSPALALVDDRMSTEGTGLPFGLSNNLLGWILFGVFGLIWALYFVYTSTLVEDEESGLSL